MLIRKSFKFRLRVKGQREITFLELARCSRFVWNKALRLQKDRLDANEGFYSAYDFYSKLTEWRNDPEFPFLKAASAQGMQLPLRALRQAIKEAFDKKSDKRFPKFKHKDDKDSFGYYQGIKLNGNRIYLPKLGWISFVKHREIVGNPKNATISRHGKHWYLSIQTEFEIDDPIHPALETPIGIDMGVKRFATMSDGSFLEPLSSFRNFENKLARYQRKLAKMTRGSNRWKKQKDKITKIHIKIADSRNDYLHKASAGITDKHDTVVIEDLKVRNMSRSAKGTIDKPGRNVRAKSGLNKAILDQGWGEFRRQLEYKETWKGGQVIAVSPQNTSRTCPACGHVSADNRKTQSQFVCVQCGFSENADYVAAMNILAAGLSQPLSAAK